MRILLLGHGRMGQLVESLAPEYGATIAGVIDEHSGARAIADGEYGPVDVAIDFTLADAVVKNLPQLADRQINVVIGTTGWQAQEAAMRAIAAKAGIGVLAASNFSLGMNVFQLAVEEASRHFARHAEFGAWIHESHHVMKKDAPSGTAVTIRHGMEQAATRARSTCRRRAPARCRALTRSVSRAVGDDRVHAHRSRPRGVRPRRTDRGEVAGGKAGVVFDKRHADVVLRPFYVRSTNVLSRIAMRTMFTGVGTALITPFTKSGALDEAAIKRLAKRQIDNGVHFLVPCGTTGETPTLSAAERRRVVELVLEAADGRGAGDGRSRRLRHAGSVHVSKEMQSIGVQGLLSVTPYYNKPTPEGLYQHFSRIADATRCRSCFTTFPDEPDATSMRRRARGWRRFRTSIGVKEASGNITQMVEICRAVPARFPGAVRRRCADVAVDGDWRPRLDLGGVECDSGGDVADGRGRRARRLRGGARRCIIGWCR